MDLDLALVDGTVALSKEWANDEDVRDIGRVVFGVDGRRISRWDMAEYLLDSGLWGNRDGGPLDSLLIERTPSGHITIRDVSGVEIPHPVDEEQ